MESPIEAMYRAMLEILNNPAAMAGPIPAIHYPVAVPLNNKADKEAERRDQTNQRFAELQKLVAEDTNGKMSQANILRAAFETVTKIIMESSPDPQLQGINDALEKIKQLTITHLESLKLPETDLVQKLEEMLAMFRDIFIPGTPITTLTAAPLSPPATFSPPTIVHDADKARKEIRKNREQSRRNIQSDGFGALRKFIAENKIDTKGTQKIQVLEAIIAFIQNKPQAQPPRRDSAQYLIGFEQGKHLAQNVVITYFENHPHLSIHIEALKNIMNSQLGPLDNSIKTDDIELDQVAFRNFQWRYPNLFVKQSAPKPTIAKPVRRIPFSLFRPWE
ncbi:hypothetical protein CAEBREN_21492 [Caenorhabditis brenneri]|uniref:BHLH domain-containing protein n=1 Tax=Caenorhabditis brenneri TaxID=135651 RepID=G0M9S9_CAEBE|nr:hypothetical protein CAEBREN_21492 [Caenorhabditis brenneri]